MRTNTLYAIAAGVLWFSSAGCSSGEKSASKTQEDSPKPMASSESKPFGKFSDGAPATLYVLKNGKGMEATLTNYGATLVSLRVPDRAGKYTDVITGFDSVEGFLGNHPYFGAIIGRYGNRIGNARFTLDGTGYKLAKNNGENTLHGGVRGFDKVRWQTSQTAPPASNSVSFEYVSKDGEEGFPGTLTAVVNYSLTDDNEVVISYSARTDKNTVVNLTNHAYFNLKGQGEGDILEHEVLIHADNFTPVDKGLIPTGKIQSVKNTPFDFTKATAIGARIKDPSEQLKFGGGYDHNFVLNGQAGQMRIAAEVYEPSTGRVMQVHTTEPGLQFYTGNFLDGSITGKGGKVYGHRSAFCMETQHFPDSPNQPAFPSTVLKPGEVYSTKTAYRFSSR